MFDLKVLDTETIASLFDVSTRQVRTYVADGMPSRKDGRKPLFDWHECLEWYVAYQASKEYGEPAAAEEEDEAEVAKGKKENLQQAMLRKTRAEANLKELALSRQRAEVITIHDAKVRLDRMLGNLRARLLSAQPKLASMLEGEKERTGREAVIRAEIESLCREISTGAIVDLPPEPETIDEISASADNHVENFMSGKNFTRDEKFTGISNVEILHGVADLLEFYDPVQ